MLRNHMALRAVAGALMCLAPTLAFADTITLDAALQRAAKRPAVEIAGTESDATRSELLGAGLPTYNPEIGVAIGPKRGGGETLLDFEIGVFQTFERGGKRAARRAAAEARVRAADAEVDLATLLARLEAWRAFELALVARARLETATTAEQLAIDFQTATKDLQSLGAGTQLRINVATAEVGRARHDRIDAENLYEAALAELAAAIGAGPQERVEPEGTLEASPTAPWTEDEFVAQALAARPELVAAKAQLDAARGDARLADALAAPDITFGISYGFDQDPDVNTHAVLFSVSIALPVRNKNQGARGAARAREKRADLEEDLARVEIEREARLAFQTFVRAREAVVGFDADVSSHLQENLALASASFTSGAIDYFEFSVMRKELVAGQLAYLDAVAESIEAWYAVQRTGGIEQ